MNSRRCIRKYWERERELGIQVRLSKYFVFHKNTTSSAILVYLENPIHVWKKSEEIPVSQMDAYARSARYQWILRCLINFYLLNNPHRGISITDKHEILEPGRYPSYKPASQVHNIYFSGVYLLDYLLLILLTINKFEIDHNWSCYN